MPRGSVGSVPAAAPRRSARGPSQLREDQRRQVSRLDALGRAAAVAPLLALGVGRADPLLAFLALVLLRTGLAGAELARAGTRGGSAVPRWAVHLLDALLLAGMLALTGGSSSDLLPVLLVAPVAAGAAGALDGAAWLAGTALAAYAAAVVVDLLDGSGSVDAGDVALASVAIVGTGIVGIGLGRIAQPLVLRAARTRSGTSRLLNAGLDLADRERRRVSQSLHEGPLQDLLAARQEVEEGDPAALQHANRAVGLAHRSTLTAADALDPRPGSAISLQERLRAALERRAQGTVRVSAGARVDEVDEQLLLELALGLGDVVERHAPEDALITARVDADGRQVKLWVDTPGDLGALRRWTSGLSADAAALGCSVLLGAGGPGRTTVQVRLAPPAEREERARAVVGRRTTVQAAVARATAGIAATAWAVLLGSAVHWPGYVAGGVVVLLDLALVAVALGSTWRRYPSAVGTATTVVGLVVLTATTGGAASPLGLVVPLGAFVVLWAVGGRAALRLVGALLAAYLVGAVLAWALGGADLDPVTLARIAVVSAWAGVLVQVVEGVRRRLVEQAEQAEAERRAVLSASLAGAGAERSRLAGVLRDGALNWLERAEADLRSAVVATGGGRREPIEAAAVAIGHATTALRAVSDELHPPALEHSGLAAALRTGVARMGADAGLRTSVEVDEAVGGHDELLIALVRELVVNACRHARAQELVVRLRAGEDGLHLEVADDGRGMAPGRLEAATHSGRTGLAVARERAEAVGGWLRIRSSGEGTVVAVHLPAARPLPPAPGELSRVG